MSEKNLDRVETATSIGKTYRMPPPVRRHRGEDDFLRPVPNGTAELYRLIGHPLEAHVTDAMPKTVAHETFAGEPGVISETVDDRHRMIVGHSAPMLKAVELSKKAAASRSTVLLLGESGTGKEIFARSIHGWSERRDKPFVAINCVGLSKELLESELFGHEKGAFTGAFQAKKGKMELAHGGTVFLDEVGDISMELQTKLLRFIEEREFERVGGTGTIRVDVRIIAATNCNLDDAVRKGLFREDLYYRLNVILIALPALRDRKNDIAALADYFLKRFSVETKKTFAGIAPEAQAKLAAYEWPGNVRELANVIERAVVLGEGPELLPSDLPARIISPPSDVGRTGFSFHSAVNDYRRELIAKILTETDGNRSQAAQILGLQRTYLSRLIKNLRLH
jgi:Nif-specific regulatory protein